MVPDIMGRSRLYTSAVLLLLNWSWSYTFRLGLNILVLFPSLVVGYVVKFTDTLQLLTVTLDLCLSFDHPITEVCHSCHFHTLALRHIWPLLINDAASSVANSIASTRLDYCNGLLSNTTEPNLIKLQCIKNTLTCITCQSPHSSSASSPWESLHWLQVRQCVNQLLGSHIKL